MQSSRYSWQRLLCGGNLDRFDSVPVDIGSAALDRVQQRAGLACPTCWQHARRGGHMDFGPGFSSSRNFGGGPCVYSGRSEATAVAHHRWHWVGLLAHGRLGHFVEWPARAQFPLLIL